MNITIQIKHFFKKNLIADLSILIVLLIFIDKVDGQVLVRESRHQIFDVERSSILRGKTNHYLSLRYQHEWKNAKKGKNDLLTSKYGNRILRNNRFHIYPEFNAKAYLNGGNIQKEGFFIDLAPTFTLAGKYNFSTDKNFNVTGWTRLEKHSIISSNDFNVNIKDGRPVLISDFSWDQAIGWSDFSGSDNSWIEYRIGDGGITINYPGGDFTFGKTVPIWSSGYSGQLWLSNKVSSFTFLGLRHSISEKWSFAFLHGSLNSNIRDSTFIGYYPKGGGLPLIRKMIAVHRLDFTPQDNIRIGIGESVVYGSRSMELNYALPLVPYWAAQSDLSNSDNLQIIVDWELIKRRIGRLYGTLYLDEWDLVDTFNTKSSRNWVAFLTGVTLNPQTFPWKALVRLEMTRISPYVYVHRSPINSFEHRGVPLGHWIGSNGEGIFASLEARPIKNLWIQLYANFSRRGKIDPQSINRQYRKEKVNFLYRSYDGHPESRSVIGIRSTFSLNDWCRIDVDVFSNDWRQHELFNSLERGKTKNIDGYLSILIGF